MAIGASGQKDKVRESSTTNGTQTRTLSDRAAAGLNQGISDVQGMSYGRFDPSTIDQYQSPYTQDVIDATVRQADYADSVDRNRQTADFAGAGAFGDKRRGIYEAELAGAQSRDRGELIAGLNDRAFTGARDVAVNENNNSNTFALALQQLLAQLRGGFGNEGTVATQESTVGKRAGTSLGLTGSWGK